MQDLLTQFLSTATIVFCLAIWGLVWVQRKLLEHFVPSVRDAETKWGQFWRNLFLPLGPVGTGAILGALFTKYPYPEVFASFSGRFCFGVACGLLSGLVYRLIKKNITEKLKGSKKTSETSSEEESVE